VFWLTSRAFAGPLRAVADAERAAAAQVTSTVEESLSSQALIQAYNGEQAQASRLAVVRAGWLRARMAGYRLNAVHAPLMYLTETLGVLTVFGVGAGQLTEGRISLGGLLSFAILVAYLYPQLQGLTGLPLMISAATASAARVSEILDAPQASHDGRGQAAAPAAVYGRIEFDDVSFSYPGTGRLVLDRLCFAAEPGRMLAIIGPSGAGKSTITRLMLRFGDPLAGRVLLDGTDVRDLPLPAVREAITVLPQDSPLLDGTIADNIRYGQPGASDAEVVSAATAAGAHAFITALPGGYAAPAGHRGRLLSGGQRQRIAIARAILRDVLVLVLVLDEPSAGLDQVSARRVLDGLRHSLDGRTLIVITHEPALASMADDILVLGPAGARSRPGRPSVPSRPAADPQARPVRGAGDTQTWPLRVAGDAETRPLRIVAEVQTVPLRAI
jgi:ATP-binding cassette, subfamily B, bacterial